MPRGGLIRYKPNRRGMRDLAGAETVRADLHARAERIAAEARTAYEAKPPHQGEVNVYVDSAAGTAEHPRARAAVIAQHPAVIPIEKHRHPLTTAMDAGRTP